MLAAYLLDPEAPHRLEDLVRRELGAELPLYDEGTGKKSNRVLFDQIEVDRATPFGAAPAELALTSVLNLRQRLTPMIDEHYFGNAVTNLTCRLPRAQVHEQPLVQLAEAIRASRRRHDAAAARVEHAARCREWKEGSGLPLRDRVTNQALEGGICINSEVGTPLYDVDFGAGRPFWVVRPRFPIPRFALWSPAPREGQFHLRIGLPHAEMRALCSAEGQRRLCPGARAELTQVAAC
jgi:hypothetical protein